MHELRFLFRIINLTRHDDNKQINSSSLTSMPAIITRELRISPIRLSRYILEKRLLAIVKICVFKYYYITFRNKIKTKA